ncbi:restriction endonuclease subunit S [Escherichia coli]|uniref:restriction endonuclease subunit S n=1 Tax=Escherichia coli TaxID=562 RepID=UPI000E1CEC4D|nr:restriction endonuclease subunit S [Escherichia coli]EFH6288182.1 restriction endonuclease subunit S [Escherichia coli]EHP1139243.1 restriction endonuclease subunit S [Escherichia coli]EIT3800199.1 restriction endonuclease subunit S [Escherichia coli]MDZ8519110.1 restriction endonuclease subunit S [Escherichia coli]NJQ56654.1 restriction endonuclease subunit S [Escherichia coli]
MGSKWVHAKLGDYIDSNLGKMLDQNKNKGDFHPYLGNSNVRWGYFDLENLSLMKFEEHESDRYGIRKGDLIICEGGEPGRCAIWEDDVPNMKIQKALHRVRPLPGLTSEYLYYWFLYFGRTGQLDAYFTGTTIKHLTGKALSELPIEIPPIDEQKHISMVLGSLDTKIKANRKINKTLEQMSQTLFKSWFVDFDPVIDNALDAGNPIPEALQARAELRQKVRNSADFKPLPAEIRSLFPSEFEETELGWVPKGWDVVKTEDIAIKIGMGPFGSNIKASQFVSSGIPIINGQQLKGLILEKNFINYITDEHANILKNSLVYEHDIVLTHRGTLGQVSLIPKRKGNEKFVISQSQFYLRVDRKKCSPFYMIHFLKSRIGQEALLSNASQVGVPSIARPSTHLKKITFINPPLSLHKLFDNEFEVILEKIMNCKEQSLALTALRDTLLPKLISGELSLDDLPDLTTDTEAA